jgi:NTE family protein
MNGATTPRIGLSLSGGGVRAAAFHLGLLKRLAREALLESVSVVSTVSGGSLVTAAIISRAGAKWPSSELFVRDIYPAMRELMTSVDLFSIRAISWSVLKRRHIGLLRERATTVADLLESNWGVTGLMGDLPNAPRWIINTTCIETGKNWRFQKREMGDWSFGKHYAPEVRISTAAAASAAVPYVIGAMPLDLPSNGWWRTDPATNRPVATTEPRFARVHLWDGGAYENLGLEPVYKTGRELIDCNFLICSDASGPLRPTSSWPIGALLRGKLAAPRLFDVSSDQIRSLRSRMLVADLASKRIRGALVRMGNSVRSLDVKATTARTTSFYDTVQSDADAFAALDHPTDLAALTHEHFDRLARHGFEAADTTLTTYNAAEFPRSISWSDAA